MDHMLYIAMAGAKNVALAQHTNSNNLANVSTVGFKADLDAFESLPVYGPGHDSRVYTQDERKGLDLNPGAMMTTGRDLDVAINGEGWLAVQADDGTVAYSRRGDLRINSAGLIEDGGGRLVMGINGPTAVPPYDKLVIGRDGTISIRPLGQGANTLAVVDRLRLVNPPREALAKGEDGLMRTQDGRSADPDASVAIINGALESSNVNSVEAMVKMIELARNFETQVKLMKVADDTDAASTRIMQMG
jgi:flagellar basal-body rod protein FlgF